MTKGGPSVKSGSRPLSGLGPRSDLKAPAIAGFDSENVSSVSGTAGGSQGAEARQGPLLAR